VEDCLVDFHGLTPNEANALSEKFRKTIQKPMPDIDENIFYHGEPFDIACDLADKKLKLSKYRKKYDQILERHDW
jgi:hypothetical protein